MQNKVKISKRQLKEDKFTTFMLDSKDRFLETWQFWVIGLVAIVLIIAAISYYSSSQADKSVEASEKLAQAVSDYRSGSSQIAILSLNQLVDDYGNTDVAEQAMFLLGKVNFESKNYAEAITWFENYIREFRSDKLRLAAAHAGLAACYEEQGDFVQAAAQFEAAIDAYPTGPMVPEYLVDATRVYLLNGDVEPARLKTDQLQQDYPNTLQAQRALQLLSEKGQPQT